MHPYKRIGGPYDSDQDGVPDDKDNAPNFPNPDQGDADGDGTADVLDTDIDNDGIGNFTDVCPFDPLNSCAGDHDSDAISDSVDPCPQYPGYPGDDNPDQADADTNGIGDACQCLSGNGGGGTSVPDVRIGMFYVYGNSGEQMVADVDPFFGTLGARATVQAI